MMSREDYLVVERGDLTAEVEMLRKRIDELMEELAAKDRRIEAIGEAWHEQIMRGYEHGI